MITKSRVRPAFHHLLLALGLPIALLDAQTDRTRVGAVKQVVADGAAAENAEWLADVRGLVFAPDGRILASDATSNTIRVFSADGAQMFAFGRNGAGPGDLQSPCCLSFDRSGRLWVLEQGNRRYSIFALDRTGARYLFSVRTPSNPSGLLDRVAWNRGGEIIDLSAYFRPTSAGVQIIRTLVDSAGKSLARDTLAAPDANDLREFTFSRSGVGSSVFAQPYGPRALYAFGPGGQMARGVGSRYSVQWTDVNGRTSATAHREVPEVVLSRREQQIANATIDQVVRRNGLQRSDLPFGVPRHKPALDALFFDLDGRLWVKLTTPDGAANVAHVYSAYNRMEGVYTWPANINLYLGAVRGASALGLQRDESGILSIVRVEFVDANRAR